MLIAQACRIVDRLEALDRVLRGDSDTWIRLVHDLRTESYVVTVDGALVEERQQAQALRQILGQLNLGEVNAAAQERSLLDRIASGEADWLPDAASQ